MMELAREASDVECSDEMEELVSSASMELRPLDRVMLLLLLLLVGGLWMP